jgi:hypothetical protein
LDQNLEVQLTISGATAAWVLERPMVFGKSSFYAFPAYSTTTFTCWAGTAHVAGSPRVWHDLRTARFIRLYEARNSRLHTAFVSLPRKLPGNDQVQLHYRMSGAARPLPSDIRRRPRPQDDLIAPRPESLP